MGKDFIGLTYRILNKNLRFTLNRTVLERICIKVERHFFLIYLIKNIRN